MARAKWLGGYKPPTGSSSDSGSTSGGSTSGARSSATQAVQESAGIPLAASGIIPVYFGLIDVATGLTASQLYRVFGHSAPAGKQVSWIPPFRGEIVALTLRTDANKTAGTLTVTTYVGGVATGALASLDDGADSEYEPFAPGAYPFAAGEEGALDLRITTASLTPAASMDLEAVLFVSMGKDLASAKT
jgi:hypothetical protein